MISDPNGVAFQLAPHTEKWSNRLGSHQLPRPYRGRSLRAAFPDASGGLRPELQFDKASVRQDLNLHVPCGVTCAQGKRPTRLANALMKVLGRCFERQKSSLFAWGNTKGGLFPPRTHPCALVQLPLGYSLLCPPWNRGLWKCQRVIGPKPDLAGDPPAKVFLTAAQSTRLAATVKRNLKRTGCPKKRIPTFCRGRERFH